ncbi:hypothetical protein BHM03_00035061 [Ensete ventricosum]|uniref:Uncharacterized protein n=1 Tax=Ensete ventricosum TaxID=4639 RepID=A0A445MJC0_ENSVE|nr:hypothetical protein BHM03_00035061 [Ensete ventricosum]
MIEQIQPKVIATIGGFAYFLDKNGSFRNSFSDGWDRVLSKHPVPFYYCIGDFNMVWSWQLAVPARYVLEC